MNRVARDKQMNGDWANAKSNLNDSEPFTIPNLSIIALGRGRSDLGNAQN